MEAMSWDNPAGTGPAKPHQAFHEYMSELDWEERNRAKLFQLDRIRKRGQLIGSRFLESRTR